MTTAQTTAQFLLVEGSLIYRRVGNDQWVPLLRQPDTLIVTQKYLESTSDSVIPLYGGVPGVVLGEEWGYVIHPVHAWWAIMWSASKEDAEREMAQYEGLTMIHENGFNFVAEPKLRHRYVSDWVPADE